jgi:hypothetical protein
MKKDTFGCCGLTIRLDCLLLQLQVFGILELCGSLTAAPMKNSLFIPF